MGSNMLRIAGLAGSRDGCNGLEAGRWYSLSSVVGRYARRGIGLKTDLKRSGLRPGKPTVPTAAPSQPAMGLGFRDCLSRRVETFRRGSSGPVVVLVRAPLCY